MSPTNSDEIVLEDRSGADLDDKCGAAYWWNRIEGGIGLVPRNEPLYFEIGRAIHEDFHTIGKMEDIRIGSIREMVAEITRGIGENEKVQVAKMEILYRRLGWIVAWALYREPRERALWETIALEKELILDRKPLWVQVTPDRLTKSRLHGFLRYVEFKTVAGVSKRWMDSWKYSIQIHTSIAAVNEELDRATTGVVKFAQIIGLNKGYISATTGHLMHPYVWAYYNRRRDEWTSDYSKARGDDWTPMPVWEYPGGVVEWVINLGEDVALSQFPNAAPVMPDKRLLDDWVLRRTSRLLQINRVKDLCREDLSARAVHFEKRTRNCRPAFGDPCPYQLLCHNAAAEDDPMRSGDFVKRQPHHELEIIGLDQ